MISSYIGRYHRVRPLGAHGWGAPYVFDRGRAQQGPRLIPAPYDRGERLAGGRLYGEWWQSPDGLWVPQAAGGAGGTYTAGGVEKPELSLVTGTVSGTTQATLALNSAYTYNSAGAAIAVKFRRRVAETLSTVYFFLTAYTGTAANVNDLSLEFRDHNTTTGPGSTLHDSVVKDPGSATGWIASTGWTFVLTANTTYWLVLGDADGNGTDSATALRSLNAFSVARNWDPFAYQTPDGWSATRTAGNAAGSVVLVFTSGRSIGSPFSAGANSTSSTNQRGLRFVAPTTCKIFGAMQNNAITTTNALNLWAGTNGPSGSPDAQGTTIVDTNNLTNNQVRGWTFETPPTVTQGTTYRLVWAYSGAATSPAKLNIGTGTDATLRAAMLGGGNWYWTEASGTTDWSNDDTSAFPQIDVILDDFVTASGGGGMRLAGHGGLAA